MFIVRACTAVGTGVIPSVKTDVFESLVMDNPPHPVVSLNTSYISIGWKLIDKYDKTLLRT